MEGRGIPSHMEGREFPLTWRVGDSLPHEGSHNSEV